MNILFFITPKREVAYISDDFSLRQTIEKMEFHKYTAMPMLNEKGMYIGTITEGDLLRCIKNRYDLNLHNAEDIPIKAVQRRWHNDAVNINCNIEDLVTVSMRQNFVPVVDDEGTFIGIIRRRDIIQYCYEKSGLKELERQKNLEM
ncbi:MAG: CBS domain-containing protein [Lachnospiraceae bacterium]|nr:CBS domain-containing protein [Lachnospiraceae bacterium]